MDALAQRVARRFTAEHLTKEWLMGVRRGWLSLLKPNIVDYEDVVAALFKLREFTTNLREQVLNVRRGPLTSVQTIAEGKKLDKLFAKLQSEISEAIGKARHWQDSYEGLGLAKHDPRARSNGEHMLALYQSDFEGATSSSKPQRGRGGLVREAKLTEFFDDVLKALYADAKRLKDDIDAERAGWQKMVDEEGWEEPFEYHSPELLESAFKEFDFGGMKIVVVDPKFNGRRIREYVQYVEMAYKDTKRKGFGALWYGTLFLMSDNYEKLSKADQEAYAKAGYKNMEGRAGTYHSGSDIVRISAPPKPYLVRVIVHELGHRYWFKFMSGAQRARFESLIEGDWSMLHALLLNQDALDEGEARVFSDLYRKVDQGKDLSTDEKALIKKRVKELGLRAGVPLISEYAGSRPTEAFAEVFERYVVEADMSRDQLESFKAVLANVVPFKPKKPSGPTLAIGGRKYVLSDYFPMLTDLVGEPTEGGAKLIDLSDGNPRFSYLWAYDTDKKFVAMWRVSDGDEKAAGSARSFTNEILTLERKGQLNRVTHDEMRTIERFMVDKQRDAIAAMKKYLEENADEWDRTAKKLAVELWEAKFLPRILAKFKEIEQGVKPLGFKVDERWLDHRSAEAQAKMFVAQQILKDYDMKAVDDYARSKGHDPDNPPGDIQALEWARGDVVDEFYDRFFR